MFRSLKYITIFDTTVFQTDINVVCISDKKVSESLFNVMLLGPPWLKGIFRSCPWLILTMLFEAILFPCFSIGMIIACFNLVHIKYINM